MHVHLDPVGGVAGDMFVAALLNVWPELAAELPRLLAAARLPDSVSVQCLPWSDHGLQGKRYQVIDTAEENRYYPWRKGLTISKESIRKPWWRSSV